MSQADLTIENERLKTTLMVLQQKLKVQDDSDMQISQHRQRQKEVLQENFGLREENNSMRARLSALESANLQIDPLRQRLQLIIDENSKLRSENSSLQSQLDSVENDLRVARGKNERLRADLAESEDARRNLKFSNDGLN